jgi:hypothetical protein
LKKPIKKDFSVTKPSNIRGIEDATHRSWDEWVAFLDTAGATELEHKKIADLVHNELEGKIESAGWWAQGVTVAYEQHIGRRSPGQKNDGSYEVSVTKLMLGTKQDVFALWTEAYGQVTEFDSKPIENIRTSITPIRSYWRADFTDGSRLAIAVEQKTPEKAMIAATHTRLVSETDKDNWQRFWRETLDKL